MSIKNKIIKKLGLTKNVNKEDLINMINFVKKYKGLRYDDLSCAHQIEYNKLVSKLVD